VSIRYPGLVGLPPGIDARTAPWFEAGVGQGDPVWGNLHLDEQGDHTLLPVSMAILDAGGHPVGVAAIEVSLAFIQGDLLVDRRLGPEVEATVLDQQARVVVSSSESAQRSRGALRTRWLRRKRFAVPEAIEALKSQDGGYLEVENDEGTTDLIVWSRMGEMGWTYVVRGPRELLMR
jgi:hypothetical protein